MNKRTITFSALALVVALLAAAVNARPVWADESTTVKVTGAVVSIDAASLSFVLQPDEGAAITVIVAEGFDFTALAVDDQVKVTGTMNPDGSLSAMSVEPFVPEEKVTGTVLSIDEANHSFVIQTADGSSVTVIVPEGFDFTTIAVGDPVEIEGVLAEDGSLTASEVKVVEPEDDDGDKTGPSGGFYCQNAEAQHPMGARLAARYAVDYATLLGWFCQGYGWGQILLALQTGKISGLDPSALLEERGAGNGWGQIWHLHGLTNKSKQGNETTDQDGDGLPDEQVKLRHGNGHGRPGDEGESADEDQPGGGNDRGNGGNNGAGHGNGGNNGGNGHGNGHGGGHH